MAKDSANSGRNRRVPGTIQYSGPPASLSSNKAHVRKHCSGDVIAPAGKFRPSLLNQGQGSMKSKRRTRLLSDESCSETFGNFRASVHKWSRWGKRVASNGPHCKLGALWFPTCGNGGCLHHGGLGLRPVLLRALCLQGGKFQQSWVQSDPHHIKLRREQAGTHGVGASVMPKVAQGEREAPRNGAAGLRGFLHARCSDKTGGHMLFESEVLLVLLAPAPTMVHFYC